MPDKLIREFAAGVKKLAVVEELDPIIENHCRLLGLSPAGKDILPLEDEYSQNLIAAAFGRPVPQGKKLDEPIPALSLIHI